MKGTAIKELNTFIKDEKIFHAYIISGSDKQTRNKRIKEFIIEILAKDSFNRLKILNENHPDIIYIRKAEKAIKVQDIEFLQTHLKNKPLEERNIAVIEAAENLTSNSQNKLLKTLEEPNLGNIIIIETNNVELLYKTVRSRCFHITLPKLAYNENEAYPMAMAFIDLLNSPVYRQFENIYIDSKDEAIALLDSIEIILRNAIVEPYNKKLLIGNVSLQIERNKLALLLTNVIASRIKIKYNVKPQYALKEMVLKIHRMEE